MTTTHIPSIWRGSLILVNAANPYRTDSTDDAWMPVGDPKCDIWMERQAATLLCKLMDDTHGWNGIVAVSGWRSEQEQRDIWNSSLREGGEAFTKQYVAVPGCSEHQTGLAIDLGLRSAEIDFIRPDFPNTGICRVFRSRAEKYGFIERYPASKEHITGISYEPWHFRYVGIPHAELMNKLGLTLEEYHAMLKGFRYGETSYNYSCGGITFELSYLPSAANDDLLFEHKEGVNALWSGNNMDGFVVTEWRER